MKKQILFVLIVLMLSLSLTGCCIKHAWIDANCTSPKTCSKCGKTEGEALGHFFSDATCVLPRTCNICGATEGNPLGHTPDKPSNYQENSLCTVCGEIIEPKIVPDMEGELSFIHIDTLEDSNTFLFSQPTLLNENKNGTYTVTLNNLGHNLDVKEYSNLTNIDMKSLPGYEWIGIKITSNDYGKDKNFKSYGLSVTYGFGDYYSDIFDDIFVENGVEYHRYNVNWYGQEYNNCLFCSFLEEFTWSNYSSYAFFRVPIGYDGTVFYLQPSDFVGNISVDKLYELYPTTRFFRLS